MFHNRRFFRLLLNWSVTNETVRPFDEVLHVRCVRVAAVVLAPGKLTTQQALVHGRHLCRVVIPLHVQPLRAEQIEDSSGIHGSHKAALVIKPVRVAFLRNAVADKRKAGGAERNEFVGIDGDVARVHASESGIRGPHTS